jgi:hypothetical protein
MSAADSNMRRSTYFCCAQHTSATRGFCPQLPRRHNFLNAIHQPKMGKILREVIAAEDELRALESG